MNRRAPIIVAVAGVLVAVLGVFLLVGPKRGQVQDAQRALDEERANEQTLSNQVASLKQARDLAPKVRREIGKLEAQVPPTADLPGIIRLLAGAADRAAVDFFSVSPGAPTADEAGGFSIVPAQLSITGSFFALDEFLYRVETLPRAMKVITMAIGSAAGAEGEEAGLSMQLTVEFYTTDASAGPGSIPGPTEGVVAASTGGGA